LDSLSRRLITAIRDAAKAGLDWGPCHGNFNHESLRMADDDCLMMLEVSHSGLGWRAYDLVATEKCWLYRSKSDRWHPFLSGYLQSRPLRSRDLAALPLFHLVGRIWRLGSDAREASYLGDNYLNDKNLDHYLRTFREWDADCLRTTTIPGVRLDARPTTWDPRHTNARIHAVQRTPVPSLSSSIQAPVDRSILTPDSLLRELRDRYSIGHVTGCRLLVASSNDTYVVSTQNSKYIARLYDPRWRSTPEVLYELDFLLHLDQKGVPVARPIPDKTGCCAPSISMPEGTRQLALFTYCEGESISWEDDHHALLVGQLAAAIHVASFDFVSVHRRSCWDLEHVLEQPLAALQSYLTENVEDLNFVLALAAKLRRRFQPLLESGLRWGVCHGDLNPQNIHIREDGKLGIFDFDYCGPGWVARDCFEAHWASRHYKKVSIWDSFLKGYREIRSPTACELEAVPLFSDLFHFWGLGNSARWVPIWGSFLMDLGRLRHWLGALRRLGTKYE
jgi:Ser/Thr protein kinase RdoA (MazF antagonist)